MFSFARVHSGVYTQARIESALLAPHFKPVRLPVCRPASSCSDRAPLPAASPLWAGCRALHVRVFAAQSMDVDGGGADAAPEPPGRVDAPHHDGLQPSWQHFVNELYDRGMFSEEAGPSR
jgi:hypothetical protein